MTAEQQRRMREGADRRRAAIADAEAQLQAARAPYLEAAAEVLDLRGRDGIRDRELEAWRRMILLTGQSPRRDACSVRRKPRSGEATSRRDLSRRAAAFSSRACLSTCRLSSQRARPRSRRADVEADVVPRRDEHRFLRRVATDDRDGAAARRGAGRRRHVGAGRGAPWPIPRRVDPRHGRDACARRRSGHAAAAVIRYARVRRTRGRRIRRGCDHCSTIPNRT